MGKNKLKKFNEMETFPNVFQCAMSALVDDNPVVQMAGHWHERYFHNNNPIILELGCGHGEYTVGLAKQYPNCNFIGVDIKGARMWHGAKQALEAGLTNVAFLRINIEWLTRFFVADEVSEIWITFPDPQMKKATKRLTSTYFLQRYQQLLRADGLIHLKTDSPFLYIYTRAMLEENHFTILSDTSDLYAAPASPDLDNARALQTHYEHQWLSRGLSIKYLCFPLSHHDEWHEPEIEIERDTYRSYGRNYVSEDKKNKKEALASQQA